MPCASVGGFDFPIDPSLNSLEAVVYWQPEVDPGTIVLSADVPIKDAPATRLHHINEQATRSDPSGTSMTVKAGALPVRLLLLGAASPDAPLAAIIPFDAVGLDRIEALTRFWRIMNDRPFPTHLRLTRQRRRRLRLMLQALDGHCEGASYRLIAKILYGTRRVDREHWKTSSLRDATIALVRDGRVLISGGYRTLLRHRRRP